MMSKGGPKRRRGCAEEAVPPKRSQEKLSDGVCVQSPRDAFQDLIAPLDVDHFFSEFWEKKPLHLQRPQSAPPTSYHTCFQLSDLQSLCSHGLEYHRDVNVVRSVNGNKKVFNKKGGVTRAALTNSLFTNKASVQFHQPQRFKDELWRIQERLECFFGALVGSNVYITPEDSQALPPHYDDVEVFVLQLEGQKRWRLYPPTVPLAAKYGVESERNIGSPTHDIVLKTGDLLYFPRGTVHQAETPAGVHHSTHLTLSTYQRMSWGDLLLDVFPRFLLDCSRTDVELRRGVPRRTLLGSSDASHTREMLAVRLRSLAEKMERGTLDVCSTHMKKDFIKNRLPPYGNQQQTPVGPVPTLDHTVSLSFKDHMVVTVENLQRTDDEDAELVLLVSHSLNNVRTSHMMGDDQGDEDQEDEWKVSKGLQFPLSHVAALQQLQEAEAVAVKELQLCSEQAKVNLVVSLWSERLLCVR